MRRTAWLAALLLAVAPAAAKDAGGAYAIKGAGQATCADYAAAFAGAGETGGTALLRYAGWLEGYLTGFNHFQDETYDLAPWQTTELMLAMIAKHCVAHPERSFTDAANALALIFYPDRLDAQSDLVRVEANGQAVFLYRDLLEVVRARLGKLGHPAGAEGDAFGRTYADALKAFQAQRGLTVSGLPDQPTMNALFLATDDAAPAQ